MYLHKGSFPFYITYEELKPIYTVSVIDNLNKLFILPMRNWNIVVTGSFPQSRSNFLYYLWGIETVPDFLQPHYLNFFLYYLWGIETYLKIDNGVKTIDLFILPMRNWNKNQYDRTKYYTLSFLYYLWGIETCALLADLQTYLFFFLYYLWGIETLTILLIFMILDTLFILPMRNWNPFFKTQLPAPGMSFYITYEELKHSGEI